MPDKPEEFSERARAFLDAQGRGVKHVVTPDQYSFDPTSYPKIPTMAELEQLKKDRPVPTPGSPIPGGWNPPHLAEAQTLAKFEREERIRFLADRLGQEQENFEANVDLSFKLKY